MANKKYPAEGGHARGHSNMEHSLHTDEIKDSTRKSRRRTDRDEINERLDDTHAHAGSSERGRTGGGA